jgi:DnaJ-class molecular chaperone
MGCKYACVCGGFCPSCTSREAEEYFGEAEDISSRSRGFKDYDDEMEHHRKTQEQKDKGNKCEQCKGSGQINVSGFDIPHGNIQVGCPSCGGTGIDRGVK